MPESTGRREPPQLDGGTQRNATSSELRERTATLCALGLALQAAVYAPSRRGMVGPALAVVMSFVSMTGAVSVGMFARRGWLAPLALGSCGWLVLLIVADSLRTGA